MIKLSILLISNLFSFEVPPGCPENSFCQNKVGLIRTKWIKVLKTGHISKIENFRKQNGIPIGVWSKSPLKSGISWNSPCPEHNPPKETIYHTDIFLKKIKKKKSYLIDKSWRINQSGQVKSHFIPRNEVPGLIDGNNLLFIREEEGYFYGIHLSPNGSIKVITYPNNLSTPHTTQCPKSLITSFKNHYGKKNLYKGSFCKNIWNKKSKKFEKMIFGWSCL